MRIAHKSIIILINNAIAAVFPIVMAILLVRLIDKETFGLYRQVSAICMFLTTILCLNLHGSMYYFIPRLTSAEERSFVVQTILLAVLLGGCASAIMWFGAEFIAYSIAKDPSLVRPLRAYSLFAIGYIIILILPAAFISKDRVILAGVVRIGHVAVRAGLIVAGFAVGWSLSQVLWAVAIMGLISGGIGVFLGLLNTPRSPIRLSLRSVQEQLYYALPLAAGGLTALIGKELDKWVVMYFFTTEEFGVYSLGAMEIPILSLVTASLTSAMMPNLVRLCEAGRLKDALALWHKGIRKSSLILFPAYACVMMLSRDIIVFLFGEPYGAAVGPFRIYLTLLPVRIAVYGALLRAYGKTAPVFGAAIVGLVVIFSLSVSLIFLFRGTVFAFMAPAVATVTAELMAIMYLLWNVASKTHTSWHEVMPWRRLATVLVVAGCCVLIAEPLKLVFSKELTRLVVGASAYGVCFVAMMMGLNLLDQDERAMLLAPFNYLRRRFVR